MLNETKLLGDPHLGRKFTKGIPVERRGEREQLVREDFVRQLNPQGASVHICMGDLFDKPQVDYATLQFVAMAYTKAALNHPKTTFYVIQGNHDDSRDLGEVTAWDLFCWIVGPRANIICVTEPLAVPGLGLFLPWNPTKTAVELLGDGAEAVLYGLTTAYGHWDVDPRSASHNLIPTKELAAFGITHAYTGHIHKPDSFKRDGVEVTVVGSMQPYAQGEDGGQSSHIQYATLTLLDLQAMGAGALDGVCIRLQLQPGEQFDGDIPLCRSFDIQRLRPVDPEAPSDVNLDDFDTSAVARAALDEHEIIPEVRGKIDAKWSEIFGHEHA